jgi:hypothetical protein
MSVWTPLRRRLGSLRAAAIASALALSVGTPFAAPVEVPRIDAPVGSGSVSAAPAATGTSLLSATFAAPSAAALTAPSAAPAPILAAPAAAQLPALPPSAAATVLAPASAPLFAAPASAAPAARAASFGKRVSAPAQNDAAQSVAPAASEVGSDADWARSATLFDLSVAHGADSAAPQEHTGLPGNEVGKVLARLRRAGASGRDGPGTIPGMSGVEWAGPAGQGNSGETTKLLIGGKQWYLKRLGNSPDPVIAAIPAETRAGNEAGVAAALRQDPQLSRSFAVSPRVSVFRDGRDVFVLSEGLPAVGDGESGRHDLSSVQRADAAIVQLALGLGDMHGANVLTLGGGRFGLIDFEKLSRSPLEKATPREIDEQVMIKNFPLVDRLSANDPALYRSRFESWRADYRSGGRERLDRALAGEGWSRPQREVYLAAVDRNVATYLERLQPYLDYANDWHKRILEARAEAGRREPAAKKGLFGRLFRP